MKNRIKNNSKKNYHFPITADQKAHLESLLKTRQELKKFLLSPYSAIASAILLPALAHYLVLKINAPGRFIFRYIKDFFFYGHASENIYQELEKSRERTFNRYEEAMKNITVAGFIMKKIDPASAICLAADFLNDSTYDVLVEPVDDFTSIGIGGLNITCMASFFDKNLPQMPGLERIKDHFVNALFYMAPAASIIQPELKQLFSINHNADLLSPIATGLPLSIPFHSEISRNLSFTKLAKLLSVAYPNYIYLVSNPEFFAKDILRFTDILSGLYTVFWFKVAVVLMGFTAKYYLADPLLSRISKFFYGSGREYRLHHYRLTRAGADGEIKKINNEISILRNKANTLKKITRGFSLVLLILLLAFSAAIQISPELGIIALCVFGIAAKDMFADIKASYDRYHLRSQLNKQKENISRLPLCSACEVSYGDTVTTSYFVVSVREHIGLKASKMTRLLVKALSDYDVDIISQSDQTIYLSGDINVTYRNLALHIETLIARERAIEHLQDQLKLLSRRITHSDQTLMQIRNDRANLPTLVCTLLLPELKEGNLKKIQNIFKHCAVNYNSPLLKIDGHFPADMASFQEDLKTIQPTTAIAIKETPNIEEKKSDRNRFRREPQVLLPPQISPETKEISQPIKIIWQSENYDSENPGAVIPIESPYLPKKTHFVLFKIKPEDCYQDEKAFKKIESIVNAGRLARSRKGEQGLIFDSVPNIRDSATMQRFTSSMMIKCLGLYGDWRGYARSEKSATNEMLHVFCAVESHAH